MAAPLSSIHIASGGGSFKIDLNNNLSQLVDVIRQRVG